MRSLRDVLVQYETDIQWAEMNVRGLPPDLLRLGWKTLRRNVKGYKKMTLTGALCCVSPTLRELRAELLDAVSALPTRGQVKRPRKRTTSPIKPLSQEFIENSDIEGETAVHTISTP